MGADAQNTQSQVDYAPRSSSRTTNGIQLPCKPSCRPAGNSLRPDIPETALVSELPSHFLCECCSGIPQGALLIIWEDVALPQEEEGTSWCWLCGLRAGGRCRHASDSAVGTRDAAWVPRPGADPTAAVGSHRSEIQDPEVGRQK